MTTIVDIRRQKVKLYKVSQEERLVFSGMIVMVIMKKKS